MMTSRYRPPYSVSAMLSASVGLEGAVEELEGTAATYLGWKETVLFPSARAAALCFLQARGIINSSIILPAYTCRSMLTTVLSTGNRPHFIDSSSVIDLNMNVEAAQEAIGRETGAVFPTAMYGLPFAHEPYARIGSVVPVVADFSLAFVPRSIHMPLGATGYQGAIYSMGSGKQLSVLGGGFFATDLPELAEELRKFRDTSFLDGRESSMRAATRLYLYLALLHPVLYPLTYYISEHTSILDEAKGLRIGEDELEPRNFRRSISPLQSRLALQLLSSFEKVLSHRRSIIETYRQGLLPINLQKVRLASTIPECSHFPILVPDWREPQSFLLTRRIHCTSIFKVPVPELPLARQFRRGGGYPIAEQICRGCLLLPLNSKLSASTAHRIVEAIQEWDAA